MKPGAWQFPVFSFSVRTSGPNNGTGSHRQPVAPEGTDQWLGQDPVQSLPGYLALPLPLSAPNSWPIPFWMLDRCPPQASSPGPENSCLLGKRLRVVESKLLGSCWAEEVLTQRSAFQSLAFSLLGGGKDMSPWILTIHCVIIMEPPCLGSDL